MCAAVVCMYTAVLPLVVRTTRSYVPEIGMRVCAASECMCEEELEREGKPLSIPSGTIACHRAFFKINSIRRKNPIGIQR